MAMRRGPVRDIAILVAAFAIILGGLWLFTGTWPPAVIVESGSMMHRDTDVTYGRIGTIDPGDLVLVRAVDEPSDVRTLVEGGDGTYGMSGDVVVYYPGNQRAGTPIIHRAVAYVEVDDGEYRVRWDPDAPCVGGARKEGAWCVYGARGVTIPSIPIEGETPRQSGFLTKGDNPFTNRQIDQDTPLALDTPIPVEWMEGKARGELPWLGLIKLSFAPRYNQPDCATGPIEFHFFEASRSRTCTGWIAFGHAYAPKDLWVMLGVSIGLVVGVPLGFDLWKDARRRREAAAEDAPPQAPEPPK